MNTNKLVAMAVSAFAAGAVLAADWTVSENTVLTADRTVDALTVEDGVTLDLNGYSLTCTSLAGTGTITSPSVDLTSPSGIVTSTPATLKDGTASTLFDGDTSSRILLQKNDNMPFVVTYDFGDGVSRKIDKYKVWGPSGYFTRGPSEWTFEGSNDTLTWAELDSRDSVSWSSTTYSVEYHVSNPATYRYYRMTFKASPDTSTSNSGPYLQFNELEYFGIGELHVNVASGEMENSTVAISGNVKVVKEGLGTFKPSKTGQSYTGGTEIVAGTVKAVTIGGYSGGYAFGPAGSKIIVSTNATSVGAFDVNGQTRYGGYDFVLNGGTIKNSAALGVNSGKLGNVTLTADSAFDFTATGETWCGFYNTDPAPNLDLSGNTLSLSSATFVDVENTKVISEGTIRVNSGLLQFYGRNSNVYTNDFTKAALELSPNAQMVLRIPGSNPMAVNLGDYICNTASADTGHDQADYLKATPKVYGTFKPNTDYFHGVELQDGATIDLSGRTTALPLRGRRYADASASDTCLHTVTFAAPVEPAESITIYVKLGERDAHGKLISWDSIPDGVNFVSASGEKERSFLVTDRGLSLSTGLMIIFQ